MSSDAKRSDPWDAALYDARHAFVWHHGAGLMELLAPQPGERILDLGCGTGHLTAQIAAAGAEVVGLDSSPTMLDQAHRAYPHLTLAVGDARSFHFDDPFDAVFSNAVLHWVPEAEAVVRCVWAALKPGGRFVAEFGGRGNVCRIETALREVIQERGCEAPDRLWYFPSVGEYTGLLERGGLEVTYAVLFDRPTPLEGPQGLRQWVTMFAGAALGCVPAVEQESFLDRIEERLRPELFHDGTWYADYRRLRVVARRQN